MKESSACVRLSRISIADETKSVAPESGIVAGYQDQGPSPCVCRRCSIRPPLEWCSLDEPCRPGMMLLPNQPKLAAKAASTSHADQAGSGCEAGGRSAQAQIDGCTLHWGRKTVTLKACAVEEARQKSHPRQWRHAVRAASFYTHAFS